MEKTLSRFSQKTQINFLKLKVLVREEEQVPPHILNDMQILRFLMYADKNLDMALEKIRNHIQWRKENQELFDKASKLGNEMLEDFKNAGFLFGNYGVTKKGRPIRIYILGDGDYMAVQQKYKEYTLEYNISKVERVVNIVFPSIRDKYGQEPDGTVAIIDVKNLRVTDFIKNIGVQKDVKKMSNIVAENYPLTNSKSYVINAGKIFTTLWNLMKNLMSEKVTKQVVILNDDYLPEITKEIDIEDLPECIGGKCKYKVGEYPNFWDEELQKSIEQKNLGEEYRKMIENKYNQF